MPPTRRPAAGAAIEVKPRGDSISPPHGATEGGDPVVISGTGMANVVRVTFGTQDALEVRILGMSKLSCIAPPNPRGRHTINAYTSDGIKAELGRYIYE